MSRGMPSATLQTVLLSRSEMLLPLNEVQLGHEEVGLAARPAFAEGKGSTGEDRDGEVTGRLASLHGRWRRRIKGAL